MMSHNIIEYNNIFQVLRWTVCNFLRILSKVKVGNKIILSVIINLFKNEDVIQKEQLIWLF